MPRVGGIRWSWDRRVRVGQPVEVYSRRSDQFNTTGHIRFVHPGFSRMPARLWLRGQMLWARKLRVELTPPHALLPGESVQVRILAGDDGGTSVIGPRSEDAVAFVGRSVGEDEGWMGAEGDDGNPVAGLQ